MANRPLIIYHADCVDGFTAAWVAHSKFGDDADYVPAKYGDVPPDVQGRDVWILDFSYPRALTEAIHAAAASLAVFDHHKTAQADLAGLPYALFDQERSGAGLTWDILCPDKPRPKLVDYVEDRDLWRFGLPGSAAVNACIGTWPRVSFAAWAVLVNDVEVHMGFVIDQGTAILRKIEQTVVQTAQHARTMAVSGSLVPVVNCTTDTSDVVGRLAGGAPFAVGWYQDGGGTFRYSLRSRGEGGVDVSEIARRRGGGGHRNAAGFESNVGPDELFGSGAVRT